MAEENSQASRIERTETIERNLGEKLEAEKNSGKSGSLEAVVEAQVISPRASSQSISINPDIFYKRYVRESTFREMVHDYLGLSIFQKGGLKLGKVFRKKWYGRRTKELIYTYAEHIRTEQEKVQELEKEKAELQKAEEEIHRREEELKKAESSQREAYLKYGKAEAEKKAAVTAVETTVSQKVQEEEGRANEELRQLRQEKDARLLVQQKLTEHLTSSPLLKINAAGVIEFNEEKLVQRLEDLFLKEIVDGIEKESGSGFISNTIRQYNEVISHWDELEELGEIGRVDWVRSMIYSRSKGYRRPTFPYLIAAKHEETRKTGRGQVASANIVDSSGSMKNNNRWQAAIKMELAAVALMRKLNPDNKTYSAHFNDAVYPVSSAELLRLMDRTPKGGTRTDLALEWLLNTLKEAGPAIANLTTDGYPECNPYEFKSEELFMKRVYETARRFRDYPLIKLRIFGVDLDESTKAIVRYIQKEAGAKVCFVDSQRLGKEVIKDYAAAIGEMHEVGEF